MQFFACKHFSSLKWTISHILHLITKRYAKLSLEIRDRPVTIVIQVAKRRKRNFVNIQWKDERIHHVFSSRRKAPLHERWISRVFFFPALWIVDFWHSFWTIKYSNSNKANIYNDEACITMSHSLTAFFNTISILCKKTEFLSCRRGF